MRQFDATVISNHEISPHYHHLILRAPDTPFSPGQFVMIQVNRRHIPLLRRAMAIFRWENQQLEIVYKAIGRGTNELAKRMPGEVLNVLGPLGNRYETPPSLRRAHLVTGGTGMVPLYPLARLLRNRDIQTILYFGGASSEDLLMQRRFTELDVEVVPTTMDGSVGRRGLVTEALEERLGSLRLDPQTEMIFTCGPHLMMQRVSQIAATYGIQCQVSLETRMACGTGVCLGCVVGIHRDHKKDYPRVCTEGPVFYAKEVDWDARVQ